MPVSTTSSKAPQPVVTFDIAVYVVGVAPNKKRTLVGSARHGLLLKEFVQCGRFHCEK